MNFSEIGNPRNVIFTIGLSFAVLSGCVSYRAGSDSSLRTDGWHGSLRDPRMPEATIQFRGSELIIWGSLEFPAKSRIQAAQVALDALLRSELSKFMKVSLVEVMEERSTIKKIEIERITQEISSRRLRGEAKIERAWKLKPGSEKSVLHMLGRLRVTATAIRKALSSEPKLSASTRDILSRIIREAK